MQSIDLKKCKNIKGGGVSDINGKPLVLKFFVTKILYSDLSKASETIEIEQAIDKIEHVFKDYRLYVKLSEANIAIIRKAFFEKGFGFDDIMKEHTITVSGGCLINIVHGFGIKINLCRN